MKKEVKNIKKVVKNQNNKERKNYRPYNEWGNDDFGCERRNGFGEIKVANCW